MAKCGDECSGCHPYVRNICKAIASGKLQGSITPLVFDWSESIKLPIDLLAKWRAFQRDDALLNVEAKRLMERKELNEERRGCLFQETRDILHVHKEEDIRVNMETESLEIGRSSID